MDTVSTLLIPQNSKTPACISEGGILAGCKGLGLQLRSNLPRKPMDLLQIHLL